MSVASREYHSGSASHYRPSGKQYTGIGSRFTSTSKPEGTKWPMQIEFTTEPANVLLELPRECIELTERQTLLFHAEPTAKFLSVRECLARATVSGPLSIEKDLIEPRREKISMFKEISCGEQIIKLKSPIKAKGVVSDEGCTLSYEPLAILVSAPTLDECKEDFQEVLDVLYEEYAEEADERLTKGAQELKKKLLTLVGRTQ